MPTLPPGTSAAVFEAVAEHLSANPFHLYPASKAIHRLLGERELDVPRPAVTFILRGIGFGGVALSEAPRAFDPGDLAASFRDNVRDLCANAAIALSEEEAAPLDRWLLGERPSGT